MRHPSSLTFALLFCGVFGASSALASTMYRYKDDNGRMVMSNTVPSDATKHGYEVLNSQGRVVKVVPPAPTEEELKARAQAEQRKQAAERQREADEELLRIYSHPDDAVRALNRKLQERHSLVQLKRGNIAVIDSQLEEQQGKAADLERAGRKIPDNLKTRIERLQSQKRELEQEINKQDQETAKIRESYEAKIQRLEQITGESRTVELHTAETRATE
ncbi:DUF4124 domain-containing protein [Marinobacter sp. JSM 1782161]|uniref:DUF4124 domain-containing protein n=1 Tax=Marinobacter sp. JSM 1782161 TaxID=2685906 RepID=UPI0014029943|nr:DUF4124 domain-containing protein [Marinobacter sp. JSM 1782161]